jgi:hypothetical protein
MCVMVISSKTKHLFIICHCPKEEQLPISVFPENKTPKFQRYKFYVTDIFIIYISRMPKQKKDSAGATEESTTSPDMSRWDLGCWGEGGKRTANCGLTLSSSLSFQYQKKLAERVKAAFEGCQ